MFSAHVIASFVKKIDIFLASADHRSQEQKIDFSWLNHANFNRGFNFSNPEAKIFRGAKEGSWENIFGVVVGI